MEHNNTAISQRLLDGKVAVVTGAAAGIGEAIAHLFGAQGAHVFILDLNGNRVTAVADHIRRDGGSAFSFLADVRKPEAVRTVVRQALEQFGRIDILINNAGVYPRKPFLEMSEQEWDDVQETNLKGVFHCTMAVLPHMVEQRAGKIVNISSVTFFKGLVNLTHYVAAV